MTYCVFMHRSDSIYDDKPDEQYQFPKQYLGRAEPSIGDWIVYLEPTKVSGSRGYFAIAKVKQIIPDPGKNNMYIAIIEPGTYLDFPSTVPFSDLEGPIEQGLLNEVGKISGRAQSAVRPISPVDFDRILEKAFSDQETMLPRDDEPEKLIGFEDEQTPFVYEQARERRESLTSRVVRDHVFRRIVLRAYDERCAITGLKLINGGGRAEVNAAHIRPVEENGPDIVNNGIALSGTVHWMFDRGLISLGNDLEILISRQINDPSGILNFVNKSGFAHHPKSSNHYPHPRFLEWHRENRFKS